MMPDSPADRHPLPAEAVHLICPCQLDGDPPRSLCGLELPAVEFVAEFDGFEPCVVCLELGAYAFAARRCERCPA